MIPARVDANIQTVRRQFQMRAARFAAHDAIVREVATRLFERLAYMRQPAARVVDLGCGRGACRRLLQRRFPSAQWLGIDLSDAMLRAGGGTRVLSEQLQRWLGRKNVAMWVCASAEHLPLADASVDVVFSNLMLHWHPQPHVVIAEIARVLRAGGLILFSSYGPDTCKELRAACQSTLAAVRPMPFVDMHDLGDMLIASGFETPVMEADTLHLSFGNAPALLAEA
ncbi:MAG TPA: methyltransferase domain-containing protein, partial [Burkholderiaceae bacterium]|nr:methyltransferase domain-containing protein [Burkholderiaceae bacterium]